MLQMKIIVMNAKSPNCTACTHAQLHINFQINKLQLILTILHHFSFPVNKRDCNQLLFIPFSKTDPLELLLCKQETWSGYCTHWDWGL